MHVIYILHKRLYYHTKRSQTYRNRQTMLGIYKKCRSSLKHKMMPGASCTSCENDERSCKTTNPTNYARNSFVQQQKNTCAIPEHTAKHKRPHQTSPCTILQQSNSSKPFTSAITSSKSIQKSSKTCPKPSKNRQNLSKTIQKSSKPVKNHPNSSKIVEKCSPAHRSPSEAPPRSRGRR